MTRIERMRFRLRSLSTALVAVRSDLVRGWHMKPIAGADGESKGASTEAAVSEGGEGSKEAGAKGEPEPETKKEAKPKPPWGSDDEFDPERAWKLIEGLRGEKEKLQSERESLQGEVNKHEEANKTEQEKLETRASESDTKAQEADGRAKAAETEAARLRVALRKGLDETQAKRLVGDTEEELEADADDLLKSFGNGEDDESQKPPRRPREAPRPGAVPKAEPEETDPRKLAAGVPSYS